MAQIFRLDPRTFLWGFATWAVLTGLSLLTPGGAFDQVPAYAEFGRLGLSEKGWGALALADGLLLAASVQWGRLGWRAAVSICSAALWFAFGALVTIGGWRASLPSAAGAYDVLASLYLAIAGAQWANTLAPIAPSLRPQPDEAPWT